MATLKLRGGREVDLLTSEPSTLKASGSESSFLTIHLSLKEFGAADTLISLSELSDGQKMKILKFAKSKAAIIGKLKRFKEEDLRNSAFGEILFKNSTGYLQECETFRGAIFKIK